MKREKERMIRTIFQGIRHISRFGM